MGNIVSPHVCEIVAIVATSDDHPTRFRIINREVPGPWGWPAPHVRPPPRFGFQVKEPRIREILVLVVSAKKHHDLVPGIADQSGIHARRRLNLQI